MTKVNRELVIHPNVLLESPIFKANIQLKMFSKILTAVRRDKASEYYSFPIKDILKEFNYDEKAYRFLRRECEKMFKPVDVSPREEKAFHLKALFVSVDTVTDKSMISFKFNPDLKPLVIDISKGFTSYYLENILRLESAYSTRIYQLLKEYEKIGFRELSLDEFKYALFVPDTQYKKYNDFKRKIILISQEKIKAKTDIYFTFEEIKTSRKITHIRFDIFKNEKNKSNDNIGLDDSKTALYKRMIKLEVKPKEALNLCNYHTVERLENNIRYAEDEIRKGKNKNNTGGFVVKAIADNFYNQTALKFDDELKIKREKQKQEELEKEKLAKIKAEQAKLSNKFYRNQLDKFLLSLSDEEKKSLLVGLKADLTPTISKIVKDLYSPFLKPAITPLLPDFEEEKARYIKGDI